MLLAFGRLRDGVRPEQARAELAALTAQFGDRHPDAYPPQARPTMRVTTLRDALTERARPTFLTLLGAVLCILLIVCANVANLMLARLVQREKELAVRSALGAGRRRLMRQLLTESTLLALLGGGLGLLLARGLVGVLSLYAARFTSRAAEIQIDGAVLAFTLAISVLTGLVFGSLPGLPSFRRLAEALHDGARGTPGSAAGRMRHALIAAQLAASFVLLIGAALLMRSVFNLHQVDPGFDAERVVSMRVTLNWSRYSGPDFAPRVLGVFEPLVERVRALPGVESVGAGIRVPLDQAGAFNTRLQIEGRDGGARVEAQADFHLASEDFFRALGVAVLRGRGFTEADAPAAPGTALVNESMERRRFGGDAVGRRLSLDNGQTWLNVVGVVGDVRQSGLDREAADEIYLPFRQNPGFQFTLFVRAQGDPQAVARQVRGVVQQLDPETPVSDVRTLAAVRHEALAAPRLTAVLQGLFAALALLVTATGLSGVVAFSVSRRTQEIGVRMALGAQPADVVRLLLSQAMRSLGLGLVLGAAGALGLGRVLTGLLFGVQPTDAACFAASAVVLVLVALLACFLPARRATAIDPLLALRAS
jgi:predicted permease